MKKSQIAAFPCILAAALFILSSSPAYASVILTYSDLQGKTIAYYTPGSPGTVSAIPGFSNPDPTRSIDSLMYVNSLLVYDYQQIGQLGIFDPAAATPNKILISGLGGNQADMKDMTRGPDVAGNPTIFVSNVGEDRIYQISINTATDTGTLLKTFSTVSTPNGLAYAKDGFLYAVGGGPSGSVGGHILYQIDPVTGTTITFMSAVSSAILDGVAYDSVHNTLYIADLHNYDLISVPLSGGSATTSAVIPGTSPPPPDGLAYDPANNTVYAALHTDISNNSRIYSYSVSTNTWTIDNGPAPGADDLTPQVAPPTLGSPEPETAVLFLTGGIAVALGRLRRRQAR